jgi:transcriptional pleiotropic regulator of transition state genes
MKSTGMIRSVDELGRLVLPKSIRMSLDINDKDELEVFVEGNRIILQKREVGCIFCNHAENLLIFNGKHVCARCQNALKDLD